MYQKPHGSKARGLRKLVVHEINHFHELNLVLYSSRKRYIFTSCHRAHNKDSKNPSDRNSAIEESRRRQTMKE